MATKRRIEIFTAGCPVCDDAVRLVNGLACEDCNVVVYNLNEPCESGECLDKVKEYGIKRLPAIVVDGRLADCCVQGAVTEEGLRASGIGVKL